MNGTNQEAHRFLGCLSNPVALLSDGLCLIFANDAFKRVFCISQSDIDELVLSDFLSQGSVAEFRSLLSLAKSVSGVLPCRFVLADEKKVFYASLTYLRDPDGNRFLIQGKQQLEERYLRLNRELGETQDALARQYHNAQRYYKAFKGLDEFLSILMHDIRSPLSTICTSLQLVQEDLKENDLEGMDETLTIGSDSAKRLLEFVDRLYQNVRVGHMELALGMVDLQIICTELKQDLMSQFDAVDGEIVFNGMIPPVLADRHLVRQLFQNIFLNAVKFKSAQRPLRVEVGSRSIQGKEFELYIRDNGRGFEQNKADHLFERYHKGAQSANDGMGIGLATCKMIADKHGWTLRAEGVCDQGATFYIGIRSDIEPL